MRRAFNSLSGTLCLKYSYWSFKGPSSATSLRIYQHVLFGPNGLFDHWSWPWSGPPEIICKYVFTHLPIIGEQSLAGMALLEITADRPHNISLEYSSLIPLRWHHEAGGFWRPSDQWKTKMNKGVLCLQLMIESHLFLIILVQKCFSFGQIGAWIHVPFMSSPTRSRSPLSLDFLQQPPHYPLYHLAPLHSILCHSDLLKNINLTCTSGLKPYNNSFSSEG